MRFNTEGFTPSDEPTTVAPINVTALNQALDDFTEKKAEFNKLKEQLIENFRQSLNDMAKEIFTTIPDLKAISWYQYTPYFNDGDECRFRIAEVVFYNFVPDRPFRYAEQIDDDEYPEGSWAYSEYSLKESNLPKEVIDFLSNFDTTINANREFIKEIFGDHSIVSFTINGIEVSEYTDHD